MDVSPEYLIDIVDRALQEDIDSGDITTSAMVDTNASGRAVIRAKADGIISGLDVAALTFYQLDPSSDFSTNMVEGSAIKNGEELIAVSGKLSALLSGERTALNFLMHLSGIATLTSAFVQQVKHTQCKIIDTRKTTPGLRLLEKRAVASGGGSNHRMGLYDMILIKGNHIKSAGSLERAVVSARDFLRAKDLADIAIEVETKNLDDVRLVMELEVQRVMLDNFSLPEAKEAVAIIRSSKPEIEIEASGNMTLDKVRAYAEIGVDFISAGALTHSSNWLDLSMQII